MPHEKLELVRQIALCGQMHGIVFWHDPSNPQIASPPTSENGPQRRGSSSQSDAASTNGNASSSPWQQSKLGRFEVSPTGVSRLHTWQDQRCSPSFISELPCPDSHIRLATGFGCVTAFWYLRQKPEILSCYDYAGTIQDLFVCILTNQLKPCMTTHNANSWGYYNAENHAWNTET
jgi:sugar (pentulose or hexulose) kinase